jgi:hypothetical protein
MTIWPRQKVHFPKPSSPSTNAFPISIVDDRIDMNLCISNLPYKSKEHGARRRVELLLE